MEYLFEFVEYILQTYTSELVVGILGSIIGGWIANSANQRRLREVPRKHVQKLGWVFQDAKIGKISEAVQNAKKIVRACNILRDSFANISKLLNSDIDELEELIGKIESKAQDSTMQVSRRDIQIITEQIYSKINVIADTWEFKKYELEKEIDIMLVRFGVYEAKQ